MNKTVKDDELFDTWKSLNQGICIERLREAL